MIYGDWRVPRTSSQRRNRCGFKSGLAGTVWKTVILLRTITSILVVFVSCSKVLVLFTMLDAASESSWLAILVISIMFSIVLAVFLSIWTVKAAKVMLSNPEMDMWNKFTRSFLLFLFGPLNFAFFVAMVWLNRYPLPTSTTVMFSLAIVTFGYLLFIRIRNKDEAINWKDWCITMVFVSSFLLLFSLICFARGASLMLQNRFDYHGAATILSFEVADDGANDAGDDVQGNSLVAGTMNLAWNCGSFVCLNSSTFFCRNDDDAMAEAEVFADSSGVTSYYISNGFSPCSVESQEVTEFDPDIAPEESGNPYVYVYGECISVNECPVLVDTLNSNNQESTFLRNFYNKRVENAPGLFGQKGFRLFMASLVGFAISANTYYYLVMPKKSNHGDKSDELLPNQEGVDA